MRPRHTFGSLARRLAILPLSLVHLAAVTAQGPAPDAPPAEAPSYWRDHFSLHGYLNLGYADLEPDESGQRTGDELVLGIEEDGSFPYGNAALHLRYEPAARHSFILQLAASELGNSPVDEVGSEVELDWLFYQFEITPTTRLRLGRQPVPAGIFNELRDVGVALPFFRPAFTFYREGSLYSETVDGVSLSRRFAAGTPWSVEATLYYGEFEVIEQGGVGERLLNEVDATNALGGQLWLRTPVSGLRFGVGGLRWDLSEESTFSTDEETWHSGYVSVDGEFRRFVARAEFRRLEVELEDEVLQAPFELLADLYYWQLGWLATDQLGIYLQSEYTDLELRADVFVDGRTSSADRRDLGLAVNYAFSPNWVIKAEYHEVESEATVGNELVFEPAGPRIRFLYDTLESNYTILSLATSF